MFSMLKNAFLLLLLLVGVLVNAYGAPGACSGACWSHDPAVIQRSSDGVYFRFSTGSGIQITKATSLSGPWTIQGYALPSGSSIDLSGNTDLWVSWFLPSKHQNKRLTVIPPKAPDVHQVGDLYYSGFFRVVYSSRLFREVLDADYFSYISRNSQIKPGPLNSY